MCAWPVHCSRAGGEGDPDRQSALGRRDSNLLPCPVAAERDRERQRETERGRQTGRQTGRQAGKQTDRQAGRQTERQADREGEMVFS